MGAYLSSLKDEEESDGPSVLDPKYVAQYMNANLTIVRDSAAILNAVFNGIHTSRPHPEPSCPRVRACVRVVGQ